MNFTVESNIRLWAFNNYYPNLSKLALIFSKIPTLLLITITFFLLKGKSFSHAPLLR